MIPNYISTDFYCNFRVNEIFTWLLEVADDTKDLTEGVKIVWSVIYTYDNLKDVSIELPHEDNKKRIIAKLEVNKDDIQAVLPMAKVYNYLNVIYIKDGQILTHKNTLYFRIGN